jgi:putative glutamine amidotransferase
MSLPVIGITTIQKQSTLEVDQNSAYAIAVRSSGGIPRFIPRDFPIEQLSSLRNEVTGLILSGGGDVDIKLFNGESHPKVGKPSPERDSLEIALVRLALDSDWPLFGICRGVQVVNVALGGTLITHIPAQFSTKTVHDTPDEKGRGFLAHKVEVNPNSKLFEILGTNLIPVNSFHHQAIKELAPGLVVTARATDGLIEGVELPERTSPFFGVQWHPEGIQAEPYQVALFRQFIESCQ